MSTEEAPENRITIIEGPQPIFFSVDQEWWPHGLTESAVQTEVFETQVRTFDAGVLVTRCQEVWSKGGQMQLEFKHNDGLTAEVPIVAVRPFETEEGDVLQLWVRPINPDVYLEIDYEDSDDPDDGSWEGDFPTPDIW